MFTWSVARARDIQDYPGMRVIGKLNIGQDMVKFGPKTNHRNTGNEAGNAEMGSLLQCRTSPISAVTINIDPWDDSDTLVKLLEQRSGFSGFMLGSPDSTVGFTAELLEETYKFPGDVIRFDNVLQNYGGHYSEIIGTFLCPDNYTYAFMVMTHTRDPETPWSTSRIMINGQEIVKGPITYEVTQAHDSGSASVTLVTR